MFKHKAPAYSLREINDYIKEMERLTFMRDKTKPGAERDGYDRDIASMQRYLEHITKVPKGSR